MSSHVGNQDLDQEIAIREVSRVFDLMKKLQAVLHFKSINGDEAIQMHDLSRSLFEDSFQALNNALCTMQSKKTKIEIKSEISPANSNGCPVSYESEQRIEKGKSKRRIEDHSWTNITSMPYDDGFQWRKYGEKKISGSDFPRGYFRCTYKDGQQCPATKQVQQRSNNDSPLFDVKYAHKHTCNNSLKQIIAPPYPQAGPFVSVDQIKPKQDHNHMVTQSINEVSCLNQTSCLIDGYNLTEDCFLSASMVQMQASTEWDSDSFLMEMAGCQEDYFPLWS